jgi:cell division transport system permease protein
VTSAKPATPWPTDVRRFRFFVAEALRSIKTNVAVAVAATTTVAIAVFVLGAFIPSFLFVQSAVDSQKERVDVRAYISDQATVEQVNELRDAIDVMLIVDAEPQDGGTADEGGAATQVADSGGATRDGSNLVESYEFVSKEDALEIMRERLKDPSILEELAGNPFPRSYNIKPSDPEESQAIIVRIQDLPAVDPDLGVDDGGEVTSKLLDVARFIQWTGLGLIVILLIASLLLIANTIRLSVFARRREVEIMRLVGGTNWFIRWPFVIEGVLCGLVGALLAVSLLYAVKLGVVDKWITDNDPALTRDTATTIGFATLGTILVVAGGLVGAVGSGLTIRRFLKV